MYRSEEDFDFFRQYRHGETKMNKWILEDWAFTVEVVDGNAKNCRLGLETGDTFFFE